VKAKIAKRPLHSFMEYTYQHQFLKCDRGKKATKEDLQQRRLSPNPAQVLDQLAKDNDKMRTSIM
jgi:hypothetical protein